MQNVAMPNGWQYPLYNALGQRVEDYQADAQGNPMTLTYPRGIFGHQTGTWDDRLGAHAGPLPSAAEAGAR